VTDYIRTTGYDHRQSMLRAAGPQEQATHQHTTTMIQKSCRCAPDNREIRPIKITCPPGARDVRGHRRSVETIVRTLWEALDGDHVHVDLLCEGEGGTSESLADHLDRYTRAQRGSGVAVPDVMIRPLSWSTPSRRRPASSPRRSEHGVHISHGLRWETVLFWGWERVPLGSE
jgi:hypothetical protein